MRVEAWQCERCGRLAPVFEDMETPPDDWFEVHTQQINGEVEDLLFCGTTCISMYYRPKRKPVKKPRKKT